MVSEVPFKNYRQEVNCNNSFHPVYGFGLYFSFQTWKRVYAKISFIRITIGLKLPEGTNLQRTQSTIKEIEGTINEILGNKIRMITARRAGILIRQLLNRRLPQMRMLQISKYSEKWNMHLEQKKL